MASQSLSQQRLLKVAALSWADRWLLVQVFFLLDKAVASTAFAHLQAQ